MADSAVDLAEGLAASLVDLVGLNLPSCSLQVFCIKTELSPSAVIPEWTRGLATNSILFYFFFVKNH